MGLLDRLKGLFTSKSDVKAIESMDHRFKSIEEKEPTPTIQAQEPKPIAISTGLSDYRETQEQTMPEIQKDSYELGLAAGYTGRSIKDIEASLARIEGQMVTRDWFMVEFQKVDRRIEDIERALGIIKGALPAMEQQRAAILKRMPLTKRMEDLLKAVKDAGEISFADLALRMKMDISDLRSLLSVMTKRTNMVERYRVHRTGWIKYVGEPGQSDSIA